MEMSNEVIGEIDWFDVDSEQLKVLKEISDKMDSLNREMREIKVRINDLNK
jgi:hypothetical protein